MSMNLTEIKPTMLIKDAPEVIWGNFLSIKNYIDRLNTSVNSEARSIALIDGLTTESGGISARSVQLKSNSGVVLSIQDELQLRMSIDYRGRITASSVVVPSASEDVSEFQHITVKKNLTSEGSVFKGEIDFSDVSSKIKNKQTLVNVVNANIGIGSTQKLDVSVTGSRAFLDCYNNGVSLGANGEALISLDVSTLLEGQEIELRILRRNVDKVGFVNRKTTALGYEPLFAVIGANGFETVPDTTTYKVDASTVGAFIKAVWTNIGSSTYRLLILETYGFVVS